MAGNNLPTSEQFKEAIKLFKRIPTLKQYDDILGDLRANYRDFTNYYEVLLRVLAVNEFYWAGCSNIPRMTEHITKIGAEILKRYEKRNRDSDCIEIVEIIALMGETKKDYGDGCVVFASKFAHFFIDPDAFPIVDQYTEKMLQAYFGDTYIPTDQNGKKAQKKGNRYSDYVRNFQRYKADLLSSFDDEDRAIVNNKTIDQYLWLVGNNRIHKKYKSTEFSDQFDILVGKADE